MDDKTKALFDAVGKKKMNTIVALVNDGADINAVNEVGFTPLTKLLTNASATEPVMNLLIEKTTNIDAKHSSGLTALGFALMGVRDRYGDQHRHSAEIIKKIIDKGADVNFKSNDGITPLFIAIKHSYRSLVKLLIENGADINAKDIRGHSAIFAAVSSNDVDKIKIIIDAGGDINAKDPAGDSPIFHIKNPLQDNVLKLLIEHGLDLNAISSKGLTIIMLAMNVDSSPPIIDFLLKNGIDINGKNNDGDTALIYSISNDFSWYYYRILIKVNADINIKNNNGETALMKAVRLAIYDMVQFLIDSGADVNIKNNDGKTAKDLTSDDHILSILTATIFAWKGHSKSDLELLTEIHNNRRDWSMCPVCLECVSRGDGCMYMKHTCDKIRRHPKLFEQYKTTGGIEWCVHCCKITIGHKHLDPTTKTSDTGPYRFVDINNTGIDIFFESDCKNSGGVGQNGKTQTLLNMIKFACEAQESIGKPYVAVRTKMIADIWDAGATEEPVPEVETLDFSCFPDVATTASVEVPVVNVPRPADEVGHPPIKHDAGDCIVEMGKHDDSRAVWQFDHKQPDGTFFKHTNYICGDDLEDTLKGKEIGHIGKCWEPTACRGKLYPEELTGIVSEAYVGQYRNLFNQNMANQAGGSASAGIFHVGTGESSCPLPKKKKAGKRKTYRKRGKKTRGKKKTYRRVKMDSRR